MAAHGFNWIRVWATWSMFDNNVSAVASDGTPRKPFMGRLKRLCRLAGKRGMIVDVTVSRGAEPGFPSKHEEHLLVVKSLARALLPARNVYFDVGNERNVGDGRYVSIAEVAELIAAVKAIDSERLCTASQGGAISKKDCIRYVNEGHVDFICPHQPRNAESPGKTLSATRNCLAWMAEAERRVPVHYQEPFRRGYGRWRPKAKDFLTDLQGARSGGAAGWCFHNGSVRPTGKEQGRPRRSFDMRPSEGRLFEQFDKEERAFLDQIKTEAASSANGLHVSPSGHYFAYRGNVIMLVGDSGTQCVMQNLNIDYRAWIDDLSNRGHNVAHIWALLAPRQKQDGSLVEKRYGYVYPGATPWKRKDPMSELAGQFAKWDLTQFDEGDDPTKHYWPRIRDLAEYTRRKGLCLGVTLFHGWPKHNTATRNDWDIHPFNVANGGHLEDRHETVAIHTPRNRSA